ncbi:MAG: T9SS type A sorting domain-containing protein [Candidatus Kapaibacterium sp.]
MKLLVTSFLLFAGFVSYSTNASAQWKQSTGYGSDQMQGFFGYPPYLLLSVSSSTFGGLSPTIDSLLASTDNGQSWVPFAPNGGAPLAGVLVGGTVPNLIGSASFPSGGGGMTGMLAYSNDFANQFKTWYTDTLGFPTAQPTNDPLAASLVTIGSTVFAADGAYGVYQQTSPGAKWTPDTVGMTVGGTPYSVGSLIVSGTTIFAATLGGGVMVSTNQGASWKPANNGLTSPQPGTFLGPAVGGFALSGSVLYAVIPRNNFFFDSMYNIYRTTDNGANWTQMNSTPQKFGNGVTRFAASSQSLFVASDDAVNVSNDNGKTWFQANQGLPDFSSTFSNINSIQVSGPNLVIGILTLNQIWYRKLSEFGSSSVSDGKGTTLFSLSESYPNPVSSVSKINYSLTKDDMASLMLFDVTGKEVSMLAGGYQIAGDHTAVFDGSILPAGMYFYRLTTPEGSIGHWLQLIK